MKKLLLTIFCLFLLSKTFSQTVVPPCSITEVMEEAETKDPNFKNMVEQVEQQIQQYLEKEKTRRTTTNGPVYTIPVVVHLIYTSQTDCTPANLNITNANIRKAFDVANANFNARPASKENGYARYSSPTNSMYSADSTGIKFCLATKGPANKDGSGAIIDYPTGAVLRYDGSLSSTWANSTVGTAAANAAAYVADGIKRNTAGVDDENIPTVGQWDVQKYYNVYLISQIDGNLGGAGTQGWAYYPTGSSFDRSIMLIKDFDGPSGGGASTFTHEGGHALNLAHTFATQNIAGNTEDYLGTNCSNSPNPETDCATQGDMVCDTPPHKSHFSITCSGSYDAATNSCSPSSLNGDIIHNYMDYSNCDNMFTAGQAARMRAVLTAATTTNRYKQVQSANVTFCGCDGTNKPSAQFSAANVTPCLGVATQLTDESLYTATSWKWTFTPSTVSYSGGTSSTSKNPQVAFNAAGPYTVKLKVTNAYGSDSLTKTNYVSPGAGAAMPFSEDFESVTFAPTGWSIGNPDAIDTWERSAVGGNSPSTAAASIAYYSYGSPGEIDNLISKPIAIMSGTSPYLSFKVAYKTFSSYADELRVYVSTDCGVTYGSALYSKSGTTLASNGSGGAFTPAVTADWRKDSISLAAYEGQTLIVKFEGTCDYGNNLYIDDVKVRASVATPPTANFTANVTDICQNASATFTNSSTGTVSTYSWNFGTGASPATASTAGPHSVTYSSAGTKTVTLTVSGSAGSDGETKTNFITVNAKPIMSASAVGSTTVCAGSVTLNASPTGLSNYQWWKNGSTGVGTNSSSYAANSTGTYTVVGTDVNGCSGISSGISITINPLPTATISGASAICDGASALLTANTGANLSYQWKQDGANVGTNSSTYSATVAGSYAVVVTNSVTLCSALSSAINVTVGSNPFVSATAAGSTTFCDGSSVVLNASPTSGLTYQWKKDGTNVGTNSSAYSAGTSGSYTVVGTNASTCSAVSSPVVVTVNPLPATPVITKSGYTLSCSSSTGTFQWNLNGTVIAGATGSSHTATQSGSYTVTNTVNGCSSTSSAMSVVITSISSSEKLDIQVYPNPAKNHIIVEGNFSSSNVVITITDILGNRALQKTEKTADKYYLDTEALSGGIYFIDVRSGKERLIKRITIIK